MSDINYSEEAEDIMNLFFQVDYMLYVEGPDDVCFWEIIFQKTSDITVQVQDVGGCNELKPYIKRILSNELNALVACDSDLTRFSEENISHPKVIRTYGYSIENSFVNERTIQRVVKNLGRFSAKEVSSYNYKNWFDDVYNKSKPLVLLDIYNYMNGLGISVVSDNAERFMKSRNSAELCNIKIREHIRLLCRDVDDYDENEFCSELLDIHDTSLELWLRGHFLLSAIFKSVMCFLNQMGKKVSFSSDAFYTGLITAFETSFNNSQPEFNYYRDVINKIRA